MSKEHHKRFGSIAASALHWYDTNVKRDLYMSNETKTRPKSIIKDLEASPQVLCTSMTQMSKET